MRSALKVTGTGEDDAGAPASPGVRAGAALSFGGMAASFGMLVSGGRGGPDGLGGLWARRLRRRGPRSSAERSWPGRSPWARPGGGLAGWFACAGGALRSRALRQVAAQRRGGFGGATGAVATGAGCGAGLAIAASSTAVKVLLQLARIGGGEELAAGALRHASKRLECLFRLGVEADDMDAQSRRGLLQRFHRGADIGLAAIEAVGDEHDVEARGRRLLGGLDQRRGDSAVPALA